MEMKRRLGRGLDALLGEYPVEVSPELPPEASRKVVPLALIHRNPRNPRHSFHPEELADLARSISTHGIVQPIVVRPVPGGEERYEIIAGERRWRAAQQAGLHEAPVVVLDVNDRQALELAIVENVQRSDLNPIEEARGYQALIDEFDYTQADLGDAIGRSRVHVTNTLRLLKLPNTVLALLEQGEISAGHGRALLSAQDPESLAKKVVERKLSVRETERLSQKPEEPRQVGRAPEVKSADVRDLEADLAGVLGLKVDLRHRPNATGELRITYETLEQLELLCAKLRR